MKKINKISINIIALFMGLAFSLFLGEGLVRTFNLAFVLENDADFFFESRDGFGYIGKQNIEGYWSTPEFRIKIKHNSLGFRDNEYSPSKTSGKKRIIFLGDSFTWGWGIKKDEIYTERLENILDNSEVINMGIPGYGVEQEFNVLNQYALRFAPDIIVVGFFLDDFLSKDLFAISWEKFPFKDLPVCLMQPEMIELKEYLFNFFLSAQRFLRSHSILYNFVAQKIKTTRQLEWFREGLAERGIMKSDLPFSIAASLSLKKKDQWNFTENALIQMGKICESRNIKLAVVIIPEKSQVYKKFWPFIIAKYGIDIEDLFLPNRYIKKVCEKNNISALDLLPEFKSHAELGEELYFDYDPHWNSHGHELAANLVRDFLNEKSR
jgi:hypothetical protein